jgi:hypothetical protein
LRLSEFITEIAQFFIHPLIFPAQLAQFFAVAIRFGFDQTLKR